jgi:hypothetical protein
MARAERLAEVDPYDCSHPTCGCEDGRCAADEANERHNLKTQGETRFTPVWLRREGDWVTVSIEVDGSWREIIRDVADSPVSHIWEGRSIPEPTGGASE